MQTRTLRTGYTTGACATAASAAALTTLFSGSCPPVLQILLPNSRRAEFKIFSHENQGDWVFASVIKDAGDDPDVTHGAEIGARVRIAPLGTGIRFLRGPGVGLVTLPGLPLEPGEPAINPVPRQMMTKTLRAIAENHAQGCDLEVEISVKGGEELALKTWNPRLGIKGGLSILGTTGIVKPYSCAAWIASIHRGIDVARASQLSHIAGATGSTSERAARKLLALPEQAMIDMGDFAGGMLKYLKRHPVARVTIAGGPAKLAKLAQGATDLHSSRSQVDFEKLDASFKAHGNDTASLRDCNTVLEALQITGNALAEVIATEARLSVEHYLFGHQIEVGVLVVGRNGDVLAHA